VGADSCAPRLGYGQGLSVAQQAGWALAVALVQQASAAVWDASGTGVAAGLNQSGVDSDSVAGSGQADTKAAPLPAQIDSSLATSASEVTGEAHSRGAAALAAANDALLYLGLSTCLQGPG
jgi:hypothetical protein